MAITANKLIFPVTFQDTLTDKNGNLLINGKIFLYSNTSRTVLKNWYYQNGNIAPYGYLPLPNPMTLDASGNISDLNGNIIIPGFYPFSETDNTTPETYFIQIFDQYGTLVQTIYNFPIQPTNNVIASGIQDIRQLIQNNRFWRNADSAVLTTVTSLVVCPDQHDGFSSGQAGGGAPISTSIMRNITFNKNVTGATENVTFGTFSPSTNPILSGDITPEYYLQHICSSEGGESLKYYQFPVSLHLATLNNQNACISIQAIDNSGTSPQITLSWFQFQGTGQTSVTPAPFATFSLSTTWEKYVSLAPIPSDVGTTISSGPGDDALYLWVGLPAGAIINISFTLPSVYLLNTPDEIPINDFQCYDLINTVISSPRTGDVRTSLNSFYPWGWAPMNNGTLCNSGSVTAPTGLNFARQKKDAWPLFSLIWNAFKAYDTGSNINPIAQMYDSTGAKTNYGTNAISDWVALKQLQLTNMMGQVILGTVPVSALIPLYTSTFTGSGTTITITSTANLFTGMPVTFTGTTTLTVGVIYFIRVINSTTFNVYTSFANALTSTSAASVDATGTFVAAVTGTNEGEYAHIQLPSELVQHSHTISVGSSGSGSTAIFGGVVPASTFSTGITPASAAVASNVTQPGTFMNIFIKL